MNDAAVADRIAAALSTVDGLSLLVPLREHALRWAGSDASLAVSVDHDRVEVRLVAHRLPLPALLDLAAACVREAVSGTDWAGAPLRLVVAELAAQALSKPRQAQTGPDRREGPGQA